MAERKQPRMRPKPKKVKIKAKTKMTKANDVGKLREMTGAGIMDCKRALEDTNGDFEKAATLIRERGLVKAETKKERVANSGIIESYVHNDRVGVLLEMHAETDFVAKSGPFRELSHNIVMQIAAMEPIDVETLLKQEFIKDSKKTIEELIKETISKVGENIKVEKFIRYSL